ncbi:MAG: RidA family protein [Firmicutes bacterium]|nr:RidA family protein [Candidatus Colivicinus equi]
MKKLLLLVLSLTLLCGCSTKKIVSTDKAPAAIGPYSQAVIVGDTVYCSGQIAIDPATNEFIGGDIVAQTKQVFSNIKGLLEAAGSSLNKVVKVNVFLADINDFTTVNEIYATYFEEGSYPARSAMEVANLPKGALIEIEVTAIK